MNEDEEFEALEQRLNYKPTCKQSLQVEQPAQQEPVVRWVCKGCGHEYMEAPSSCDCMESREYERIEYYTSPQPAQQEPVAWMNKHGACMSAVFKEVDAEAGEYTTPLYTSPQPSKPWVGLTKQEIDKIYRDLPPPVQHWQLSRAVEAKLREKNHG